MILRLILITITSSLLSSALAFLPKHLTRTAKIAIYTLFGISGACSTYAGILILLKNITLQYQIASTIPNISWQFNVDPLAGFFLILIGIIVITIALYTPGYLYHKAKQLPAPSIHLFSGLFISSLYLVVLAGNIFTFLFAWELMSVASYFLVIHNHEQPANRRAALVYLVMAQISGLLILIAFALLAKFSLETSFILWHQIKFDPLTANLAFTCAFLGFGMKAGVVPLHIWLPKAHPAAPSHISALMSGVMLKISVYGLIRFIFYLLKDITWQWGAITLFIGTTSALFGVLYALMQHDLKKLLAYHSVENIGIIFSALGLSLIFAATSHPTLAALGLIAALYHSLNHAIFKSLLFLGAGSITQQTGEGDLERMGGLIKMMPYVGWFFLVGCISISALPPFNGFVSEWLFFQTALQGHILENETMRILIPVSLAIIALTGALAAACFVKVYGVIFLGQPRSSTIKTANKPNLGMRLAMGLLALLCLLFGIFPTFIISFLNIVTKQLINTQLTNTQDWMQLIPINTNVSSYNPLIVVAGILLISITIYYLIHKIYSTSKPKLVAPWDCGYGGINSKMQYSATAFAMPIRRIFQFFYLIHEKTELTNKGLNYSLQVKDIILQYLYLTFEQFSLWLAKKLARIQGGNVRLYLTYIFITLIILLWLTK